ncbi:hypothetical protein GCM10027185_21290 [Spirosoma pulveris]
MFGVWLSVTAKTVTSNTSSSARVGSSQLADCPAPYEERDGLVVIEAENLNLPSGWQKKTTAPRYTGNGYIEWVNADNFSQPGTGLVETTIKINKVGKYTFQWRNQVGKGTVLTDHNDTWLRFPDASDFYGEQGTRKVYPYGSGKTPNPNGAGADGWFKVYFNAGVQDWAWSSFVSDNDPHSVIVEFSTPGVYKLQISSRSANHLIDRLVLYHSSVNYSTAQSLSTGETTCSGTPPVANRPPVVASPLADQTAQVGTGFNYTFSATAFSDPDGDALSYSASLSDGSSLPSWLQFNGSSRTFSGTPPSATSLAIRVTASDGRGGQVSDELTLTVNSATGSPQSVVSFSLMNADTEQEIKLLTPGEQLNLATLPTRNLNIRANTNPATVGSVVVVLSGSQNQTQTETAAPYALFGDNAGNYNAWTPVVGSYSLTATPYAGGNATGAVGTALTVAFTVVNQPDSQQMTRFWLINADTDQPIQELTAGTQLNLSTLPTRNLNIQAATEPTVVGSVSFNLSGQQSYQVVEGVAPYALFGDNAGNYNAWTPVVGSYSLTATSYAGANATGAVGTALTVAFTVVNQPDSQPLTRFWLINADTDQSIRELTDGQEVDLSSLPTRNLNIQAITEPAVVGSVVFELSGRQTRRHVETVAPYALFTDNQGDYASWTPEVGSYTLVATPYSGAGGTDAAGLPRRVSFVVTNAGAARLAAGRGEPSVEGGWQVRVLGNPVTGSEVVVEVSGAQGKSLHYELLDGSGRCVQTQQVQQALSLEHQTMRIDSQGAGVLLLRVSTPTRSQTVKILKQ